MLETPGTPVLHLRVFEGTVPNGVWKHGPGRPSYRRVWDLDEEESFGGGESESESGEDTPPPTLVISIGPRPQFEGLPDWLEVPDRAHDVLAQVDDDDTDDDGPGEGQSFLDGGIDANSIPWLPRLFQWLWGGTPNEAKARVDVDTGVYDVPSPQANIRRAGTTGNAVNTPRAAQHGLNDAEFKALIDYLGAPGGLKPSPSTAPSPLVAVTTYSCLGAAPITQVTQRTPGPKYPLLAISPNPLEGRYWGQSFVEAAGRTIQVGSGAVMVVGGTWAAFATAPTVGGSIAAGLVALKGLDNIQAGLRGSPTVVYAAAKSVSGRDDVGFVADFVSDLGPGGVKAIGKSAKAFYTEFVTSKQTVHLLGCGPPVDPNALKAAGKAASKELSEAPTTAQAGAVNSGAKLASTGAAEIPNWARQGLDELAQFRRELGPIPGGGQADGVLARLDVGERTFHGTNAHGQPTSLKVNAITRDHAEMDVFQQAANAGARGSAGRLFVDRELCDSCGLYGGVRSLVRQLGLERLEVVTPSGVSIITP